MSWRTPGFWPTARGWVTLAGALAITACLLVTPGMLIAGLSAAVWALILVSLPTAMLSLGGLDLAREPCRDGHCGDVMDLPVTVTNRSRRQRQSCVVVERCAFAGDEAQVHAVHSLAPHECRRVSRRMAARKRGDYKLGEIVLRGGDPVGLFMRQRRFHLPAYVRVEPHIKHLAQLPLQLRQYARSSVTGSPIGISGSGQDFYGIRRYRTSDGMRFIDWKSTARQRRLMVREFEENVVHHVTIVLDVDRRFAGGRSPAANFEFLVSAAATIVTHLATMHCRLCLSAPLQPPGLLLEGAATGLSAAASQRLTLVQPNKCRLRDQLDAVLDLVPSASIVYCLTMGEPEELAHFAGMLLEQDVELRWIHAPRALFADTRRRPTQRRAIEEVAQRGSRLVQPFIADHTTEMAAMLEGTAG